MITFKNQLVEPRFTVLRSAPKPVFKILFKCRDHELQVRLSYLERRKIKISVFFSFRFACHQFELNSAQ